MIQGGVTTARCLVTGGTEFIRAHATKILLDDDYETTVLGNLSGRLFEIGKGRYQTPLFVNRAKRNRMSPMIPQPVNLKRVALMTGPSASAPRDCSAA